MEIATIDVEVIRVCWPAPEISNGAPPGAIC